MVAPPKCDVAYYSTMFHQLVVSLLSVAAVSLRATVGSESIPLVAGWRLLRRGVYPEPFDYAQDRPVEGLLAMIIPPTLFVLYPFCPPT